jgi:hypothetical protein
MLTALPWVGILLLIAAVQVLRAQPFDAVLFAAVALAVAADAAGLLPAVRPRRAGARLVLAGALVIGVALCLVPRHSVLAAIVMATAGVVVAAAVWPDPARDDARSPAHRYGWVPWSLIAVALCLVELTSFVLGRLGVGGPGAYPAVSELLDPVLDTPLGRIVFVGVWALAGIGLLGPSPAREPERVSR